MNKSFILTFLLFVLAACGKPAEVPAAKNQPIPSDAAQALIGQFMGTLIDQLTAAIEEKGPAEAVEVCAVTAPRIAEDFSTGSLSIRRIGSRVRNHESNTPTAAELRVMKTLTSDSPIFQGEIDGQAVYMKGVFIPNAMCLTCHGTVDEIPASVQKALAKRYPNDQAINYAIGDLRGAVIVERKIR